MSISIKAKRRKILYDRAYRQRPEIQARNKARRTPEFRMRERSNRQKRAKKISEFIYNFKKSRACSICGWKLHPEILAFHHKNSNSKNFQISRRHTVSVQRLILEINKCLLLCPNCHNWIHHPNNPTKCFKFPRPTLPLNPKELHSLKKIEKDERKKFPIELINWIKENRKKLKYKELLSGIKEKLNIEITLPQLKYLIKHHGIYKS